MSSQCCTVLCSLQTDNFLIHELKEATNENPGVNIKIALLFKKMGSYMKYLKPERDHYGYQ